MTKRHPRGDSLAAGGHARQTHTEPGRKRSSLLTGRPVPGTLRWETARGRRPCRGGSGHGPVSTKATCGRPEGVEQSGLQPRDMGPVLSSLR